MYIYIRYFFNYRYLVVRYMIVSIEYKKNVLLNYLCCCLNE